MASRFTSHKIIYDTLVPVAQQRLDDQAQAKLGHKVPEQVCVIRIKILLDPHLSETRH